LPSEPTAARENVTTVVDLRSDTLTRPTPGMRRAMAEAEVGDDAYGEDPTVNQLQDEVAALLGHEAALLAPSGTMANQICLRLLVKPGQELICDAEAHILLYELGAAAAGGISTRTWAACGARLRIADVAAMINLEGYHTLPTRAIAVEQTHNRAGGEVFELETLRQLRELADETGVLLHCDGARIWNAHVATGVALAEYGRLFDTISVCLSKGLGAPVGSLVVSNAERIARAGSIRKRLGGGMRQAGILAAAGRYALRHQLARLAVDHQRARQLAQALAGTATVDPSRVATNMVRLDLAGTGLTAKQVVSQAARRGVLISALGPREVRLVTHLDLNDAQVDLAAAVLSELLGGAPALAHRE
jgi:threonine aldolase